MNIIETNINDGKTNLPIFSDFATFTRDPENILDGVDISCVSVLWAKGNKKDQRTRPVTLIHPQVALVTLHHKPPIGSTISWADPERINADIAKAFNLEGTDTGDCCMYLFNEPLHITPALMLDMTTLPDPRFETKGYRIVGKKDHAHYVNIKLLPTAPDKVNLWDVDPVEGYEDYSKGLSSGDSGSPVLTWLPHLGRNVLWAGTTYGSGTCHVWSDLLPRIQTQLKAWNLEPITPLTWDEFNEDIPFPKPPIPKPPTDDFVTREELASVLGNYLRKDELSNVALTLK